jgi:hypothetical protein
LNIVVDSALAMDRSPVSQIDFVLLQKEEKTDLKLQIHLDVFGSKEDERAKNKMEIMSNYCSTYYSAFLVVGCFRRLKSTLLWTIARLAYHCVPRDARCLATPFAYPNTWVPFE